MNEITDLELTNSKNRIFEVVYQNASDILKKSKEMAGMIVTDEGFHLASSFRKSINALKKEYLESLEELRKPLEEARQAFFRKRDEVISPIDAAMKILDPPLAAWYDRQEWIRNEKEAKARAELKRQQDEAKLNAAIAVEQSGDLKKAQAILDKPIATPFVQLQKTQAVKGMSFSKIYRINESTIDFKILINAVCTGNVPQEAIMPNFKFLNAQARVLKENMRYPGVEVIVETNVSSRSN